MKVAIHKSLSLVNCMIYIRCVVVLTIIRTWKPQVLSLHKFVKYFRPRSIFYIFKEGFEFWWLSWSISWCFGLSINNLQDYPIRIFFSTSWYVMCSAPACRVYASQSCYSVVCIFWFWGSGWSLKRVPLVRCFGRWSAPAFCCFGHSVASLLPWGWAPRLTAVFEYVNGDHTTAGW